MLPKPVVPLAPVTVKDSVVEEVALSVAIVMLDICELVILPVILRLTVEPLDVFAWTVVGTGVGVGVGAVVGFGVTTGCAVGTGVITGTAVGIAVGIGVGVAVGIGVGVAVGAGVGVGVGVTASCSVCTVPEIIPDGIAVNWKLTADVTWLTVTAILDSTCWVYSSAWAVTV